MEGYRKIAVQNIAVVKICFKIKDQMFNEGRVILDIDTYDFAGKISDDVIIGIYDNGTYTIYYYYKTYGTELVPPAYANQDEYVEEIEYEYKEYEFILTGSLDKNKLPDEIQGVTMYFDDESISITFEEFEENLQLIQSCLNLNADLIEQRY